MSDQVRIQSALVDANRNNLYIGYYNDPENPYVATIAHITAQGYFFVFNRDLTYGFDGSNWWFGYAFWLEINGSAYALTYNGANKQITLTPYNQKSPSYAQIWGMRNMKNYNGTNYFLISIYDPSAGMVMNVAEAGTVDGTPVLSYRHGGGEGVNESWRYVEVPRHL